eukprot:CAMPEP_0180546704 /NCGR_PEP_ID=MMETSP1036_2-20121128/70699_1 /TAXON_ID=632150 /ORGANISM="Azadinium spinosum, Strain 3D9" /LENGTH=37 /DNA_ID= /DNA_START= /DNA_END= /DNA_ORIENTATION=
MAPPPPYPVSKAEALVCKSSSAALESGTAAVYTSSAV